MDSLTIRTDADRDRCVVCHHRLHLSGVIDIQPQGNGGPSAEPPDSVLLWVRCKRCGHVRGLVFPWDDAEPSDVPSQLIRWLVSCSQLGSARRPDGTPVNAFAAQARFWSRVHDIAIRSMEHHHGEVNHGRD